MVYKALQFTYFKVFSINKYYSFENHRILKNSFLLLEIVISSQFSKTKEEEKYMVQSIEILCFPKIQPSK
jgi:hypothetical protein